MILTPAVLPASISILASSDCQPEPFGMGCVMVTDVLFYLFAFIYYHVLMYVAFFDIEDIEREDLKKYGERL